MREQSAGRFGSLNGTKSTAKMTVLAQAMMQIIVVLATGGALAGATQQQKTPACRGETLTDEIIQLRNYTRLPGKGDATMIDTGNVHMLHSVGESLCMPYARPALDAPDTYSVYARGCEPLKDAYRLLDTTPFGRQQDFEDSPSGWLQKPTYG